MDPNEIALIEKVKSFLFRPIHPATLGVLRIVVGLVFLYEAWDSWARYYVVEVLTDAEFRLTYDGFHWVQPLAKEKMSLLWDIMILSSVMTVLGIFSRFAFAVTGIIWTYSWLLCNSIYNNHYYLMSIIAFFFVFVHSENWLSLRNVIFRKHPDRNRSIAHWEIFIFQFQIFLVYLFGAFAKIHKDWFNGWPMKMWLPYKSLGPFTEFIQSESGALFFSYSGFLFDLIIGPMLFFKKTRWLAIPPLVIFHISNHFLWNIGVFPWFMLGATMIYFRPDWPARAGQFFANLFQKTNRGSLLKRIKAAAAKISIPTPRLPDVSDRKMKWVTYSIGIYFLIQALIPARQMLYKGDSSWTGEGFFFSWNMMLVDRPYSMRFKVVLPGKEPQWLDLNCYRIDRDRNAFPCGGFKGHMYARQWKKMGHYPKHYIRYAKFLADDFVKNGMPEPEIYGHIWRQLNNRPYQLVLDTTVNLVSLPYSPFQRTDIIMPFQDLPYKEKIDLLTEDEMKVFGLK